MVWEELRANRVSRDWNSSLKKRRDFLRRVSGVDALGAGSYQVSGRDIPVGTRGSSIPTVVGDRFLALDSERLDDGFPGGSPIWRRAARKNKQYSRIGGGPIETIGRFGPKTGCDTCRRTITVHFDAGFDVNG